jgi:hypothetical protein
MYVKQCYSWSGSMMKAKVTLKIDAELLHEAGILSIDENSSISTLAVRNCRVLHQARERAKARLRIGFNLGFTPSESRDELYDR